MRLLQDCADVCNTTADFHLRGSPHHEQITSACANICDLCATACEAFIGDPQMKACANECRLCAIACRESIARTAGGVGIRGAGLAGAGLAGAGAGAAAPTT